MNIGWREFIKSRFRKPSQFHSVGIEFGTKGICISSLQKINGEVNWVKQHSIKLEHWQDELKAYVVQHKLSNTKCYVALSIAKYNILKMDRPAVEEPEIVQALQWSVKEQVPSEGQLVIDYFDSPTSSAGIKQLNVVALAQKEVEEIRDGVLKSELVLESIGLEELAICHLLPESDDAVIVLSQEHREQLSLNIIKQRKLYFSRRLKGYENLGSLSPEELSMGMVDNLSLEIQRSMDYFESQLRQAPVKRVYTLFDTLYQDALAEQIKNMVFVSVEKLPLGIKQDLSLPFNSTSFTSLGAALSCSDGAM